MDKAKQQVLYDKYPKLFRQKDLSIQESCMYFGIATNDGWYDLIEEVCSQLSKYENVEFSQIKEKYGSIRLYLSSIPNEHSEAIYKIIDEAELKSEHICEVCGAPGSIDQDAGWLECVCEEHKRKIKDDY